VAFEVSRVPSANKPSAWILPFQQLFEYERWMAAVPAAVLVRARELEMSGAVSRRSTSASDITWYTPEGVTARERAANLKHDRLDLTAKVFAAASLRALDEMDLMQRAARALQRFHRDRLRARLIIAPRVQSRLIADEIARTAVNLWRFARFFIGTSVFLIVLIIQNDPSVDGAQNLDGSSFRADYSSQRAVGDAIDDIEWDGPLSSWRDVRNVDHLWTWLDAAVDEMYDENTYVSAAASAFNPLQSNSSGFLGSYNKQIGAMRIIQQRRKLRDCTGNAAHSLNSICYEDYDVRHLVGRMRSDYFDIESFVPLGVNRSVLEEAGLETSFDWYVYLCTESVRSLFYIRVCV